MSTNLENILGHEDTSVIITKNKPEDINDAKLRRFKDGALFITALLLMIGVVIFCGYLTFTNMTGNIQLASLALNGVIGITLGIAGYVLRGKK